MQAARHTTRWLNPGLLLLLLFSLMGALVALRALEVDRKVGQYIACPGCFVSSVLVADGVLFGAVGGLLLMAGLLRPRGLVRVVHLAAGLPVLVYAVDLVLFRLFNARLFMSDAALFIRERAAVWDQFQSGMSGGWAAPLWLAAAAALFLLLWWLRPIRGTTGRAFLLCLLLWWLTSGMLADREPYVNRWAVDNVFAANLVSASRNPYSTTYVEALAARPRSFRTVSADAPTAPRQPNVIVLLMESWSSWHSRAFGGFHDWTPQLDAAAQRGLRFENFHAIGFSTDKGLMGILAGEPLWAPFIHWYRSTPFQTMWGVEHTLPALFNGNGYYAAFLTAGPLDLYDKGLWLGDLGFAYVEGREHPYYANQPRFAFGSAPDRALYERAEQWRATAPEPWLLVLETVTTHQPYRDPDTGQKSLELAMRYADREFGAYLTALDRDAFFESGVLLVISDHRSMTPIPAEEFARFGLGAWSRVPMFAIGGGFTPGSVDRGAYSQSHLVPSMEWWLTGSARLGPLESIMFPPKPPAAGRSEACALHLRGNERGKVNVICDAGEGVVQLDGDRTRFIEPGALPADLRDELLREIARIRLDGLSRHARREQAQSGAEPSDAASGEP